MAIVVTGKNLKIEDVYKVAYGLEKVELHADAVERLKNCRAFIEKRIEAREIMYGVNTGIGEFSEVVLTDEQVGQFQKYLIYNHAAGIGTPVPIPEVRAAMLARINVHANGYSGCRPVITQTYVAMLNKGVTPVVCNKGSVGACGDLAPMSQIALLLMGEGEAFYEGERMPGAAAMKKAGIPVPGLQARDGLAAINGSNLMNGMACLQIYETERLLKQAEIAAAMTLEALMANMKPYDARLHKLRGFQGAVTSAENIKRIIEGSDLLGKVKVKVQDAYSMRSTPQVLGAARDQLRWTRSQIEIELNGVGDNPIFLPDDKVVLTGANFQGSPISVPLDMMGACVTMTCVISERRLNRLLNPALSVGLPSFLTKGAGMYSGLHAQPVHGRHDDRRAAHPVHARLDPVDPGRRRPGGLRLHGHEHGPENAADHRQRLRHPGHRVHRRRPGPRLPRTSPRARAPWPPRPPCARWSNTWKKTGPSIPTTTP